MQIKTEKLTIKILRADKYALERIASVEGEPVAVIVRQFIREGMQRRGLLAADPPIMPQPLRAAEVERADAR